MDTKKSSVSRTPKDQSRKLRALEERYRHELMGAEERLEIRERILRLKRGGRL